MALVNSSGDSMGLRIYEPSLACEYASPQERADHRSRLLAAIHNAYCKALERLTVSRNSKARRPLAMRPRRRLLLRPARPGLQHRRQHPRPPPAA
ncbi:hypothetical protein C2845_PM06G11460 [Panicum miliaceum]|uniref:Uncharacterized protein n=1 Tax=Panicum miliaceum TaxID=4540 RepID=A0A3L6REB7_PANMI|nr:hypothetical protein C2845_PM06G11460 [Panicum miliaceum]